MDEFLLPLINASEVSKLQALLEKETNARLDAESRIEQLSRVLAIEITRRIRAENCLLFDCIARPRTPSPVRRQATGMPSPLYAPV